MRYYVSVFFSRALRNPFPTGTLIVNLTGSFLLGLLLGSQSITVEEAAFWGTGFLGAYTTFSTFNYDTFVLTQSKRKLTAYLYFYGTYLVGFLSAALGFWLAHHQSL
ncbi:fluoride efflux transporter FluC [Peribacillus sp. SCS-155]|uniref:fluoride efflux transporter FluC n=1 Tax=Peribacillus sedimenti TaxID=3115297 RepID=UPI00390645D0